MWKVKFRSALRGYLEQMKSTLGGDTLRTLAKKAGLSPSTVSEILNGKRKITESVALKILDAMDMDVNEKKILEDLVRAGLGSERRVLPKDAEQLIANWHFSAILSLLEINEDFDVFKISEELRLNPEVVSEAIRLLASYQLVETDKDGKVILTGDYWTTTEDIPSGAIKIFHKGDLKLAAERIDEVPPEDREFTSLTFAGSAKQFDQIKNEIRKFRDKVSHLMTLSDPDQVYKFNIQLYPMRSKSSHNP
ncbi:MAG: TIGR02147 family protein [Bdellovibrionales bacterium]|nr:TIGR02147 family protein [Bdellovibrionales bacterium]